MHVVNWREQIDSWWRRNAEKQTDNFCSLWIMQNILPRCEGFRGEAVECSERPTYTSCQSSCFAHWRRAHSAQRVAPDCEPPLPRLWTCSGCLCWGCWHSDGLAGPQCYDSPPHGGLCRPTTPASRLLGQLSRRRNLSIKKNPNEKNDPPFGFNRAEQSPSGGGGGSEGSSRERDTLQPGGSNYTESSFTHTPPPWGITARSLSGSQCSDEMQNKQIKEHGRETAGQNEFKWQKNCNWIGDKSRLRSFEIKSIAAGVREKEGWQLTSIKHKSEKRLRF